MWVLYREALSQLKLKLETPLSVESMNKQVVGSDVFLFSTRVSQYVRGLGVHS